MERDERDQEEQGRTGGKNAGRKVGGRDEGHKQMEKETHLRTMFSRGEIMHPLAMPRCNRQDTSTSDQCIHISAELTEEE